MPCLRYSSHCVIARLPPSLGRVCDRLCGTPRIPDRFAVVIRRITRATCGSTGRAKLSRLPLAVPERRSRGLRTLAAASVAPTARISSPAAVAKAGPPSRFGQAAKRVGRPMRTCLSRIERGQLARAGQLAAPPVSTTRRPGDLVEAASLEPVAHQLEDLFQPRLDDADQHRARHVVGAGRRSSSPICGTAIISRSSSVDAMALPYSVLMRSAARAASTARGRCRW